MSRDRSPSAIDRGSEPPPAEELLGGRYRLGPELGHGAMGFVYEALDIELGTRVALKLMQPKVLNNPISRRRFEREARAAMRLQSPHVVKVFGIGHRTNGDLYMVMEHLEGVDLAALLLLVRDLPPNSAALLMVQLCEALAEAHSLGIIHRDLKPQNLFLISAKDGSPHLKVLDFGISKMTLATDDGSLTTTDQTLGTPLYMSPEQVRNSGDVDPRSDIWAVGVIFYELITGCRPFDGRTQGEVLARVLEMRPAPPRPGAPEVPPELDAIIRRCLEKDPANRYPDASALADALRPFSEGGAVALPPILQNALLLARTTEPPPRNVDPLAPTEYPEARKTNEHTLRDEPPQSPLAIERAPEVKRRLSLALRIAGAITLLGAFVAAGLFLQQRGDAQGTPNTPNTPNTPPSPGQSAEVGTRDARASLRNDGEANANGATTSAPGANPSAAAQSPSSTESAAPSASATPSAQSTPKPAPNKSGPNSALSTPSSQPSAPPSVNPTGTASPTASVSSGPSTSASAAPTKKPRDPNLGY